MTHAIAPLLKRYFSHYLPVQKGLSLNTVCAYRDAIKLLLCHVADTRSESVDALTVEAIDEKAVLSFLDSVENDRGCTKRTRNARLAAIRSLAAWAGKLLSRSLAMPRQMGINGHKRTNGIRSGGIQRGHGVSMRPIAGIMDSTSGERLRP